MKKILLILILFVICLLGYPNEASLQSGSTSRKELAGTTLPATCISTSSTVDIFNLKSGVAANDGRYYCSTSNNWSKLGPLTSANIITDLGYTPENVANKDTDGTLASNSDTKYPSQKATKTYVDTSVAAITVPVTSVFGRTGAVLAASNDYSFAQLSGKPTTFSGYSISDTSANLRAALADENGNGVALFDNAASPTFITPALGVPSALTLTNATGLPVAGLSNLGSNVGTFLITPSGANLASALTTALPVSKGGTNCTAAAIGCFNNITGFTASGTSGSTSANLLFSGSPAIGTPTVTTLNGNTFTTGTYTLTGTAAKTLNFTNSLTLSGTDSTTMTFPGTSDSIPGLAQNNIFTANGALSSGAGPALKLNGTWITGGSATTTKPYVLIEPTGTTSTGWSTSGTGLGVNAASGFAGNFIDLQVAGAGSIFKINSGGSIRMQNAINISSTNVGQGNTGTLTWNNNSDGSGSDTGISRDSAGVIDLGTGAQGSTAGSLKATAFTFSGATLTLSNAAFTTCTALTTTAGVLGCTASDRNLKQDFRMVQGDGLDFIRNIRPQTYSFRPGTQYFDGGRTRLGLVAQDVQKYLPEAVFPTGPGQPLQIDYNAVTAETIRALQVIEARVTALENENKRLRALLRHRRH